MCDCNHCKARRNCKTKEEYIALIKKEIEVYKRDRWCADTNLDFAQQELEAVESGELKPRGMK
jgi:hypothetical protein